MLINLIEIKYSTFSYCYSDLYVGWSAKKQIIVSFVKHFVENDEYYMYFFSVS